MHAEPDSLPAGTLLGGKYRIERLIGKGGFGAVFRATDVQQGSAAAVKVLSRASLDQSGGLGRFRREADLASRLKHANTVRVLGAGEDAQGWLYIAFELLVGRSVEQAVASEGAMAPERAAAIISDALGALDEAHKAGIIHRDLKPANLFLADTGTKEVVKILDFGIAKSLKPGTLAGLTRVGSAVGTPIYMAPEQLLGQPIGPQSDLFSLGIVLADMVLGASPYGADPNAMAVVTDRIGGKPVPLPAALASSRMGLIITRATQPDPARRFQSAAEMRSALTVFAPTMLMDGTPSRDVRAMGRVIGKTLDPSLASAKTEVRDLPSASLPGSGGEGASVAAVSAARPSAPHSAPHSASPSAATATTADEIPAVRRSTPGHGVAPPVSLGARSRSADEAPPPTVRDPQGASHAPAIPARKKRRPRSRVGVVLAVLGFLALTATVLFVLYDRGLFDDLLGRKKGPTKKLRDASSAAPAPTSTPREDGSPATSAPETGAPSSGEAPPATSASAVPAAPSSQPSAAAAEPPRSGHVKCDGLGDKDINAVMIVLQRHGLGAKLQTSDGMEQSGNYYLVLQGSSAERALFFRPPEPSTFAAAMKHPFEDTYGVIAIGTRSAMMFAKPNASTDAALDELCAIP